jgi:hypothetical protein
VAVGLRRPPGVWNLIWNADDGGTLHLRDVTTLADSSVMDLISQGIESGKSEDSPGERRGAWRQ